jgi:hypothetical protein
MNKDHFERTCYTYVWLLALVWIVLAASIIGAIAGLLLGWQWGMACGVIGGLYLTIEAWRGFTK